MSERHLGKVIAADGKTVTIAFERSEMCAHCGACHASGDRQMLMRLENTGGVKVGDTVTLSTAPGNVAKAGLWAYAFPLAALIAGLWLGSRVADWCAIVLGLGLCALAYGILRLMEKRFKKRYSLTVLPYYDEEDTNDERTDE